MIELKCLWSDIVNMSQAHTTEKEELKAQLKQYELTIQEGNKQLENMKNQEQRKEEELLQAYLDVEGKDETINKMKTRGMSLQREVEKLKQGIL